MRMDIEISPGARMQRHCAAARDDKGLSARKAAGDGRIGEKRFCSNVHLAPLREKRIGRIIFERTKGVLWRHSSVNLVEPSPSHGRRHEFPGATPKIKRGLASLTLRRNIADRQLARRWGTVNDTANIGSRRRIAAEIRRFGVTRRVPGRRDIHQ
jgi:hypothetical protein